MRAQPRTDGTVRPASGAERRTRTVRISGGIAAQFSQAAGSFVIQIMAARTLGLAEFGVFALLIGAIVVATGIMTGFVGDSLTVLDRTRPAIRSALLVWCLGLALLACVVGTVVAERSGVGGWAAAALFGATLAAWVTEDTARRLLMARMRFWSVVLLDLAHAGVAIGFLSFVLAREGRLTLVDFLAALLVGQLVAIVVGLVLVRGSVLRGVLRLPRPDLLAVARFGVWRGVQQGVRPSTLTLARVLVAVVVGSAAVGQLEAARVYMAPALLLVQGTGSFLLASYAAGKRGPIAGALRRADLATALLLGASLAMGAVATALTGVLGPLVSGNAYDIDPVAVAGWAVFAAAVAATMPYASLAAVRGRQSVVVGLRLCDAALSVGAAACVLRWTDWGPSAVPFAIAAGAFVGAGLQRAAVARSARRTPAPFPAGPDDAG